MIKSYPPDAEFSMDKGEDTSFGKPCKGDFTLVDEGGYFNPDEGFAPIKVRLKDFGDFARNSFVQSEGCFENDGGDGNVCAEGEMSTSGGVTPPTISAERDLNMDPCANADPTKMSKKRFKQLMKQCNAKDKYMRKTARTENVRARADIKRGRAHKIASVGEEKKAKGESAKINAQANADVSKGLAQIGAQQDSPTSDNMGASTGSQLISGVPNAVTYGGIAVLGLVTVIGIGMAIKSSMGAKAAAGASPAAAAK